MKKKILATILTCAILVTPASTFADMIDVAINPVSIFVNGLKIDKENFILDGTTYVPIRAVSESLGADVQYDDVNKSIYINGGNNSERTEFDFDFLFLTNKIAYNNTLLIEICYMYEKDIDDILYHYANIPSNGYDPFLENLPDLYETTYRQLQTGIEQLSVCEQSFNKLKMSSTSAVDKNNLNKLYNTYLETKSLSEEMRKCIKCLDNLLKNRSDENINAAKSQFESTRERLHNNIILIGAFATAIATNTDVDQVIANSSNQNTNSTNSYANVPITDTSTPKPTQAPAPTPIALPKPDYSAKREQEISMVEKYYNSLISKYRYEGDLAYQDALAGGASKTGGYASSADKYNAQQAKAQYDAKIKQCEELRDKAIQQINEKYDRLEQ